MKTVVLALIAITVCLCLLAGCGGVTKSEAVGAYKLVYQPGPNTNLGTETLILKADGTFIQTFMPTRGKGWTNTGKWELIPRGNRILLRHRLVPEETKDRTTSSPKPEDGYYPIWRSGSAVKIEIDPDIPYRYVKIK